MKYVDSGPARISEPSRINLGLIRSGLESLDVSIKLIASLTSWTDISISEMEQSVVGMFGNWWLEQSKIYMFWKQQGPILVSQLG